MEIDVAGNMSANLAQNPETTTDQPVRDWSETAIS